MDEKLRDAGMAVRREVLGAEYVDRAVAGADDFNKPFQAILNESCWGLCWTDDTLTKQQRSILNLGMLAALGRTHEFKLHFKGALQNGLTPEQLRAALIQIAVYCGIPAGVESFRAAREAFQEIEKEKGA